MSSTHPCLFKQWPWEGVSTPEQECGEMSSSVPPVQIRAIFNELKMLLKWAVGCSLALSQKLSYRHYLDTVSLPGLPHSFNSRRVGNSLQLPLKGPAIMLPCWWAEASFLCSLTSSSCRTVLTGRLLELLDQYFHSILLHAHLPLVRPIEYSETHIWVNPDCTVKSQEIIKYHLNSVLLFVYILIQSHLLLARCCYSNSIYTVYIHSSVYGISSSIYNDQ